MIKRLSLIIICLFSFTGLANWATYPNFLYSSIWNNGIHPTWNLTLDITYEDVSVWINITSDNLKLYKYNWSSWWSDIASTYINFWTKSIWKNHAIYSISWLDYWKYKYIFSIDNLNWNSNTKEIIFYVDRPNLIIKLASHNVWILKKDIKKMSDDYQNVNVKTIWAPYRIKMIKTNDMLYGSGIIVNWNWNKWWGYSMQPYINNILTSIINNTLNSSPLNNNISGNLNNDEYIFKVWGLYDDDLQYAWEYKAKIKFDINFTYCPEYNLDNTCKTYGKFIKTLDWARKWEDWNIAKSCYYYKYPENIWYEYLWEIWDWEYWIRPDSGQSAFKVYCDMTTNWWWWTRYVNIKWNYNMNDAKDCWLGTNISNSNLDCFNPNRYSVNIVQLFNNEWNWNKYYYNLTNSWASTTTAKSNWNRKCLGHNEYMTIMRANTTPKTDTSDTDYVRMWKSFCWFSRDPAGRSGWSFMNYDSAGTFWENSWSKREATARTTQLYFREKDLNFTQTDKTIVTYNWARRWSDETYAKSCNEYKNPPVWYSYSWNNWDWEYFIDSDGIWWNLEFKVTCDMTTNWWWWTKILSWKNWFSDIYTSWLVIWWDKILMTYKRADNLSKKYAIKIEHFKMKQCWEEYTTIGAYINHLQTWSWGTCSRRSTQWDYNDILTTEIIWENWFVEDTCVNWNNHKNTARNASWWTSSWKWHIQFRVSNTTVLMWPHWNASSRCAWSIQSARKQSEVDTWVR